MIAAATAQPAHTDHPQPAAPGDRSERADHSVSSTYPCLLAGFSYEVAAVDAVNRSASDHRAAFVKLVLEAVPSFPPELADWLYGEARSGHFHAGSFPLGEFAGLPIGLFQGRGWIARFNIEWQSHAALRHALIKWLLDRT